jgi:hypothetical protein
MNPSHARRLAFAFGFVAAARAGIAVGPRGRRGALASRARCRPTSRCPAPSRTTCSPTCYDPNAARPATATTPAVGAHAPVARQHDGPRVARPLFWATLAVAEQDFAGGGDFCLRCHVPSGLAGRPLGPDGRRRSLDPRRDVHGVECDQCHRPHEPERLRARGRAVPPFVAERRRLPGDRLLRLRPVRDVERSRGPSTTRRSSGPYAIRPSSPLPHVQSL